MSCPFLNRQGKLDLNELPEMTAATVQQLAAHGDKVRLIICCGFLFDVTSDPSFSSPPLSEFLYKDATEAILKMQFAASTMGGDAKRLEEDFARIDDFTKMQMRSNTLKLFTEKYKTIAKISSA